MSRRYKFRSPDAAYFITFSVVYWISVLTKPGYRAILLNSIRYCMQNKGLVVYAWVIMPNHVHMVIRASGDYSLSTIVGDFKRFSSRQIVKEIIDNENDISRERLLWQFKKAGEKSSNVKNYQLWQHDNMPIEIWHNQIGWQKINYIHMNPVKAGLVENPKDYRFSSARDYSGEKGLLDVVVLDRNWEP